MKKWGVFTATVCLLSACFFTTVYANSIWNEKIENFSYRPYLIGIIIGTLLIESLVLIFVSKSGKPLKVTTAVIAANAASFLIPRWIINIIFMENGLSIYLGMMSVHNGIQLDVIFFIVTIIIELPILWIILRKDVKSVKTFMFTALTVNFVTNFATAFINLQIINWLYS